MKGRLATMRGRSHRRCRDDRGAGIAEFALALPVIAALAIGLLEFGLAWNTSNVVERAVSAGGRTGSSVARGPMADFELLQAVNSAMAGSSDARIVRVIVYRSQTADGAVPTSCLAIPATGTGTKGVSGLCNVYSDVQVANANPSVGFSQTNPCSGWDANWCPVDRDNSRPGGDYLGVFIEAEQDAISGLFVTQFRLERSAVYLLEPPSPTEPV